jgi:hypothetical protein
MTSSKVLSTIGNAPKQNINTNLYLQTVPLQDLLNPTLQAVTKDS